MVNVLKEILDWSMDRPLWQRDALRRLVTKGELDTNDLSELSQLCKSRHGLDSQTRCVPLDASHLPQPGSEEKPVILESLEHRAGVNALAHNQRIKFGPSLTVVYGANAAGKSGYTRILKRACRARGAEEILGNVLSGAAPGRPSATIGFRVGDRSHSYSWDDRNTVDPRLSRVSVFDRHCASVYVSQRTDVAFRPLGLDLFDKLSAACEAVKKTLEKERTVLESQKLWIPNIPAGTAVHELLLNLTSLTDPATVKQLASLRMADETRMNELRRRIRDLESDDPQKIAQKIELQANRTTALVEKVHTTLEALSDATISELFAARDRVHDTGHLAESLKRTTFHDQPLSNTGSAEWRALWDAAQQFSKVDAYPKHDFPFTNDGARCVLCQQVLSNEGVRRLQQFKEFLDSAAQSEHDMAVNSYRERHATVSGLTVLDATIKEVLNELQIDHPGLANEVRTILTEAENRKNSAIGSLDQASLPQNVPAPSFDDKMLLNHVISLKDRARELREPNKPHAIKELKDELTELEARQLLAGSVNEVLAAIERKKRIAAYQLCVEETRTNSITRKSTDVTKRAVTEQLAASFADELVALKFDHVEVQMVDSGGSRGALYHKLQLRRAPGVDLSKIVSEGEARCLSIASFFSELSTAADRSAILFDDPVSSLDHNWRENVAARLAKESQFRQVIIFTHDIVFLLALSRKAEDIAVDLEHQYLRRDQAGVGLSSSRLPWPAMKVRGRIGHLNDLWQKADKIYRREGSERYEREATYIYGLLREAWERAFEEVLLGGAVERYRNTVQTQQANQLADICRADCDELEAGMSKCSRWLPGHDQAPAENTPIPNPQELKGDIDALDDWVRAIWRRRRT